MRRAKPPSLPLAPLAAALGVAALGALAWWNHAKTRRAEHRHPPRGWFVTVDGVRLHYIERGSGAPIVLLHGNGAMAEDFLASGLMDRLAASHRVIAFDRPGFGYSARPRGHSWTARRQAGLIQKALAALCIECPVIVGHSWGTLVALELGLDFPLDIAALVLLSGYFFASPRADIALAWPNATPLLGDVLNHTVAPPLSKMIAPSAIRRIFSPSAVPARFVHGFPLDLALRPKQIHAVAHDTMLMLPAAMAAQHHYRDLTVPVAIVAGDGDAIVDPQAQSVRLAHTLCAPIEIVPGAGHMIHYDAPQQIAAMVERIAAAETAAIQAGFAGWLLGRAQAVIFDIDGTLIDSVDLHAQSWQEAFRDFGHDIDYAAIRHQIGKGGDQLMPVFLSEQELREKGEALEKHRTAIFKEKYLSHVAAFAGVRTLFERLRRDGKQIMLASSAKKDEIDIYKRAADISDLVSAEVSADDVAKSKPHPDVFESALEKLRGMSADRAVVVGDSPYDAEAAGKAGLRTIGVLCGGFAERDLCQAGCAAIASDPAALLAQYDGARAPR